MHPPFPKPAPPTPPRPPTHPPHPPFVALQVNLYERLGLDALQRLATEFYDRVYADDEDAHFRAVFAHSPKAVAIKNNYEASPPEACLFGQSCFWWA